MAWPFRSGSERTDLDLGRAARQSGAGDPAKREVGARAAELIRHVCHVERHVTATRSVTTSTGCEMPLSSTLRGSDVRYLAPGHGLVAGDDL